MNVVSILPNQGFKIDSSRRGELADSPIQLWLRHFIVDSVKSYIYPILGEMVVGSVCGSFSGGLRLRNASQLTSLPPSACVSDCSLFFQLLPVYLLADLE